MRKEISVLLGFVFLIGMVSASIILTEQPDEIYNLGDSFMIPVTIKSLEETTGVFSMDLICNGNTINFYKAAIMLKAGDEKKQDPLLILTHEMIGDLKGTCNIKASLNDEYILTENDFKLSDLLVVELDEYVDNLNPGENILFQGNVLRETGENANGIVELELINNDVSQLSQIGTINNGFFEVGLNIPEDFMAGNYLIRLNFFEEEMSKGEVVKTNNGFTNFNIGINSVPTSLEIILEESEIVPGNNLKIRTILHDQTGISMGAVSIIEIKDSRGQLLEQVEISTDNVHEFVTQYNTLPSGWKINAKSNDLISEVGVKILENKKVDILFENETIVLINKGNIPYNDSVLVKIGNESINIETYLEIDGEKRYVVTAPDGEYSLNILADGEEKYSGNALLTGKAVSVKEVSRGVVAIVSHPLVWIFVIVIFGFIVYILLKRFRKNGKSFFSIFSWKGKSLNKNNLENKTGFLKPGSLVDSLSPAVLSLSISGQKQNTSVVCLKINNFKDLQKNKIKNESLKKIVSYAEDRKAHTYENGGNLFFILAPLKTRTFKNDMVAVEIAQGIKEILDRDNKLFKQRIEYGIGLNNGYVIAKQEGEVLKFMSIGTLITKAKRISLASKEEIYLSKDIKDKLMTNVKTEKVKKSGVDVYTIKEIKKNSAENKKFINNFLKKLHND